MSEQLRDLLDAPAFKKFTEAHQSRLRELVMSASTSPEEREKAVTKFHAVQQFLNGLREASKGENP
jgi:6-phosphogluconate dehydrogenase